MKKPISAGTKFGRLTFIDDVESSSAKRMCRCRCDCGQERVVLRGNLLSGNTKSCGCRHPGAIKHGHTSRALIEPGKKQTSTYSIWLTMCARCFNPKHKKYPRYGGRGITVCSRWLSFENFLADMGERPSQLTLDRIDVVGDYEPKNCRWASWAVQRRNRNDVKLEAHEPSQIRWLTEIGVPVKNIAQFFDLHYTTVYSIRNGKIYK